MERLARQIVLPQTFFPILLSIPPVVCSPPIMTMTISLQNELSLATAKRRTFAIISHPDAGKTTLTEKLLLYSGLIRTAGMVRGR